jgi:AcrR family transcriptional regulator
MKLFSIQGFDAVAIRKIAEAVGVGNSALYKHFRSKQEILDAIVDYSKEYFLEVSSKQMTHIETLSDLKTACLQMFDFQTKDEWMVMFRRLLVIEQFKNPQIAEIYRSFFVELPVKSQAMLFDKLITEGALKNKNSVVMAMELYAPFFLYHTITEIPSNLRELFECHVENFYEAYVVGK